MTIKVPLNALRLPGIYPGMDGGDEEKEVLPEQNDPVSFSVEGVVSKVVGDMAEVNVRFVNGQRPGEAEPAAEKSEESEMSEDEMQAAAEMADAGDYAEEE